jgi:hypothetical protein
MYLLDFLPLRGRTLAVLVAATALGAAALLTASLTWVVAAGLGLAAWGAC